MRTECARTRSLHGRTKFMTKLAVPHKTYSRTCGSRRNACSAWPYRMVSGKRSKLPWKFSGSKLGMYLYLLPDREPHCQEVTVVGSVARKEAGAG